MTRATNTLKTFLRFEKELNKGTLPKNGVTALDIMELGFTYREARKILESLFIDSCEQYTQTRVSDTLVSKFENEAELAKAVIKYSKMDNMDMITLTRKLYTNYETTSTYNVYYLTENYHIKEFFNELHDEINEIKQLINLVDSVD